MSSVLWSQEKGAGSPRDDWRFFMLLKECVVEKAAQKVVRVPRGSLGQVCPERTTLGRPLPPAKGKRSLRILDQSNVVVSVDERDTLELDEALAELLFPITNCEERYGLLRDSPRLQRARSIRCGSRVRVQLRSGDTPLPGVVRFRGALLPDRALSGIWFGVELLVRNRLRSWVCFRIFYFLCSFCFPFGFVCYFCLVQLTFFCLYLLFHLYKLYISVCLL